MKIALHSLTVVALLVSLSAIHETRGQEAYLESGIPAGAVHAPPVDADTQSGLRVASSNAWVNSTLQQSESPKGGIHPVEGGALAGHGLHQVHFPANVNGLAPVLITAPDGRKLAFRPMFLSLRDTATGEVVLLAQITNRVGLIVGSAQVLYTNAFDRLHADVRYLYKAHSLEQDILFHEKPALPEGFSPENTRLEVWTEWFDTEPLVRKSQTLDLRGKLAGRRAAAEATDEVLDFGAMTIGLGYAFAAGDEDARIPVAKTWGVQEGRHWLVETVDYLAVEAQLELLPVRTASVVPAGKGPQANQIRALQANRTEIAPQELLLVQSLPAASAEFVLDFVIAATVPVPAGIVSWWPAGGNGNDAITNNHGTLYNGATYAAGKVGQAFKFDGANDHVRIPNQPNLRFTNGMTFEGWVYPTNTTYYREILSKWDAVAGFNQKSFDTSLYPGGQFYILVSPGGTDTGATYVLTTNAAPLNAWTHVAGTYDGSTLKVYFNGVLEKVGVYTNGIFPGTNSLGIGAATGGAVAGNYLTPFPGMIDEPSLYDRALSAAEIEGIYQAGIAGKRQPACVLAPTNMVGWWSGDGNGEDYAGTNVASLKNGATYGAARVSGGFSFDGSDDYVEITNAPALNPTNALTVEAWVYQTGNQFQNVPIFSKDDTASVRQYLLTIDTGGKFRAHVWTTGSGLVNFPSTTTVALNGWYHVAMTFNGTNLTLYVNGIQEGSYAASGKVVTGTDPLRIGGSYAGVWGNYKFQGLIDEPTLYDRALTGTEIAGLYAAGSAGKCKDDIDHDGLPDWWEMQNFGHLDEDGNGDFDGDGSSNQNEFDNGTDPNTIDFRAHVPSFYANTTTTNGWFEIVAGVPAKKAVLVDSTNLASAVWSAYTTNFTFNLGTTDGWHDVWVGLRGAPLDSAPMWRQFRVKLDRTFPHLTITNPVGASVSSPLVQIQGFSPEALSAISYDITNSSGLLTNEEVFVLDQYYDTNSWEFTTNLFQAFDVVLANGSNILTLHATDLAGNRTNFSFGINLVADSNAPALALIWPLNGAKICGDTFTIRGLTDDMASRIQVSLSNTNGLTNTVVGFAERNGKLWVEDLPLSAGTNWIALTVTDHWGNAKATNIAIVKSPLSLTIDPIDDSLLHGTEITLSGTIGTSGHAVVVNGVTATVDGNTWVASNVSINAGGTANFQVAATLAGVPAGARAVDKDKPVRVFMESYNRSFTYAEATKNDWYLGGDEPMFWAHSTVLNAGLAQWNEGVGGRGGQAWTDTMADDVNPEGRLYSCSGAYGWLPSIWPDLVSGPVVSTCGFSVALGLYAEHCDVKVPFVLDGWYPWNDSVGHYQTIQNYSKKAQAKMKLFTGGKEKPTKSVFSVTASAAEIQNKRSILPAEPSINIPAEKITVGELGQLGSDGRLYKILADGATVDITPKVDKVDYYTFGVSATRHELIHATDCTAFSNTNSDRTTLGVGEFVSFQFVPEIGMTSPESPVWTTSAGSVNSLGDSVTFIAPSNAATAMVEVTVRDQKLQTSFSVLEPQFETGIKVANRVFAPGEQGVGMAVLFVVQPTHVSFSRVVAKELSGPASNVFGDCTNYTASDLYHNTARGWEGYTCVNWRTVPDNVAHTGFRKLPGGFDYIIPIPWSVGGEVTNGFMNRTSTFRITDTLGTSTVTKNGATATRTP